MFTCSDGVENDKKNKSKAYIVQHVVWYEHYKQNIGKILEEIWTNQCEAILINHSKENLKFRPIKIFVLQNINEIFKK